MIPRLSDSSHPSPPPRREAVCAPRPSRRRRARRRRRRRRRTWCGSAVVSVWCRWCCVLEGGRGRLGAERACVRRLCACGSDEGRRASALLCAFLEKPKRRENHASRTVAARRQSSIGRAPNVGDGTGNVANMVPGASTPVVAGAGDGDGSRGSGAGETPAGNPRTSPAAGRATESRRAARGRPSARVPGRKHLGAGCGAILGRARGWRAALVRETPPGNRERDHPG